MPKSTYISAHAKVQYKLTRLKQKKFIWKEKEFRTIVRGNQNKKKNKVWRVAVVIDATGLPPPGGGIWHYELLLPIENENGSVDWHRGRYDYCSVNSHIVTLWQSKF